MPKTLPFVLILAGALMILAHSYSDASVNSTAPIPSNPLQSGIPSVIRFNGSLREVKQSGEDLVGVTFAIYQEENGGAPLWIETQNVRLDSNGHFSVLLGAATRDGIPSAIFQSGGARWLGLSPHGETERARVMLLAVPYAFKAGDADTLRGRSIEEFVTQGQLASRISDSLPPVGHPIPYRPPIQSSSAPTFVAEAAQGPSFISAAVTGPPFDVNSTTLVPNLNVDLLHGLSDLAFAKLNANNEFQLIQQFHGGISLPSIPGDGTSAEQSSPQDFNVNGLDPSDGNLVQQTFRWQASGVNQSLPQSQLGLYFGSRGAQPTATGLSFNADGSINFAPSQSFPASAIMTAIAPFLASTGGTGGGSGGTQDVTQTPLGNQGINQPPGTTLNVNNLNNTRTVVPADNWMVGTIPVALSAGVSATISLAPCPIGVDTSANPLMGGPNGGYAVRIFDRSVPANSEAVYLTGGTCTSAASSGTITFTPYFSHALSTYSVGSASAGIQEAINDACGTRIPTWQNGNCRVMLPPTGPQATQFPGYDVYETIYFHANGSTLSGDGAVLNCHQRGPCLQVGDLNSSSDYANNMIEGISFRSVDNRRTDPAFNGSPVQSTQRVGGTITIQTNTPHNLRTGDRVTQMLTDTSNYWGDVPFITVTDATHYTYQRLGTADLAPQQTPGVVALSYEAVLDNAQSTSFVSLLYERTYEYGAFNHFFDFWDDENAKIESFNNNAIPLTLSAYWTGSFIWSGGAMGLPVKTQQLAPVITVEDSNFTANGSNCATVYNSNGFYFHNTVCQAQGPWQFLISNSTGNYQGADFQNVYSEATAAMNPISPAASPWPGLGVAGLIGGPTAGGYTFSGQGGFGGEMPVVGSGATTYVYYLVARNITQGTQTSPLPFMYEKENSPGQVTVRWPRLASGSNTIVYDVIRNLAPSGTIYAAAGGYVAPYTGACNGGTPISCGSVAIGIAQCSGLVCSFTDNTGNLTSSYNIRNGNFIPNPTFWPGTAVLSSTPLTSDNEQRVIGIAFGGAPAEYAQLCNDNGMNVSGGYTVCTGSNTSANNSVPNQPPTILTDGVNTGGGGVPFAKGRMIFETNGTSSSNAHQIITLYDSNPQKTQATTGHRPTGDPGDMYLGVDPNLDLMIGGGAAGIRQYVNNIGDGVSWGEQLTTTQKTFTVPVNAPIVNVTTGFQVNGSFGAPGQTLISTGTGVTWGSCSNSDASSGSPTDKVANASKPGEQRPAMPSMSMETHRPIAVTTPVPSQSEYLQGFRECDHCAEPINGVADNHRTERKTSGSIPFLSPLANGSCSDRKFEWQGIVPSDTVVGAWPKNLAAGILGETYVSAPNTVQVRVCNFSGASLTPGRLTVGFTIPSYGSDASAVLSFSKIENGACLHRTFPANGVSVGEAIVPKWPSALEPGLLGAMSVSDADTVEVRLCNFSGKALVPTAHTFGILIPR